MHSFPFGSQNLLRGCAALALLAGSRVAWAGIIPLPPPPSTFSISGQILLSDPDITLSNAALLAAGTTAITFPTTQNEPFVEAFPISLIAQSGAGGAPPPVLWQSPALGSATTGGPVVETIQYSGFNVISEYTDSSTGESGVALLVAEAGGNVPPPPVLFQPFSQVFNATSEGAILQDLQNLQTTPGFTPTNLDNFIQNNPSYLFQVAENSTLSDGLYFAYTDGRQIGDITATATPEPATWLLAALAAAGLWRIREKLAGHAPPA